MHTLFENTVYKNHQAQSFQIFKSGLISNSFFFQIYSNYKKACKNYKEELLSVLWFLEIISAVAHNIEHTLYPESYNSKKCALSLDSLKNHCELKN